MENIKAKRQLETLFSGMWHRCINKNNPHYENYGGRGITICDEWMNDRAAFRLWCLENGWRHGLEIDRIDNDAGYSPENCRFVTKAFNRRRQTNVKLNWAIVADMREMWAKSSGMTYVEIADIFGVSSHHASNIIRYKAWNPAI